MIALAPMQATRAAAAGTSMVVLCRIRTFLNAITKTQGRIYYHSSVPVRYAWDGVSDVEWIGGLRSVSPIESTLSHIPDPDLLTSRASISIEISGEEQNGYIPWEELNFSNLFGAEVEIATLLISDFEPGWHDRADEAGDHVVRFRGEITQAPEYDDESESIRLTAEMIEPVISWPTADDVSRVDPRDLGKRYPVPVGRVKGVPLVNREVGSVTTLVGEMTSSQTGNVEVTDLTGFPDSGSFTVYIGEEAMLATRVSDFVMNVTTRAAFGTVAAPHGIGSSVIEVPSDIRLAVSAFGCKNLNALYLLSSSGERVRIPASRYSFTPGHEGIDGAGNRLAMVGFRVEQLLRVLQEAGQEITQQPSLDQGFEVQQIDFSGYTTVAIPTGLGVVQNCEVNAVDSTGARLTYSLGTDEGISFWVTTANVSDTTRLVRRWRLILKIRIEGNAVEATNLRYWTLGSPFGQNQVNVLLRSYNAGSSGAESFETLATAWVTPPGPPSLATLVNGLATPPGIAQQFIFYLGQSGGGTSALTEASILRESYIEVELYPNSTQLPAEIGGGAKFGNGLQFVADVAGVTLDETPVDLPQADFGSLTGWTSNNGTLASPGGAYIRLEDQTGITSRMQFNFAPAVDLSAPGLSILFEMFLAGGMKSDVDWTSNSPMFLRLASSGVDYSDYIFGPALFEDGQWQWITIDLGEPFARIDYGAGVDLSSVISISWGATWIITEIAGSDPEPALNVRACQTQVRTLADRPEEAAEWAITRLAGLDAASVDSASFAAMLANVPDVFMGGDLRFAGESLAEVLARLGWESRTNFHPFNAGAQTTYKALAANSAYDFPAADVTLEDYAELRTVTRSLDERPTEFSALYEAQFYRGLSNVEAYRELLRANATTNDIAAEVPTASITAAQEDWGIRSGETMSFPFVRTLAGAVEVFAYYVTEALRGEGRRYTLTVPFLTGYAIEVGDIAQFTPRHESTPRKCRVLSVRFDVFSPSVELALEEVT